MKRLAGIAALTLSVGMFAACATGSDDPAPDTTDQKDAGTGSIVVKDGGSSTTTTDSGSTTTKTCISNCHTDSECQTSCPAAPNGGLNCCDTSSGVCYASSTSTCGTTTTDAGNPTY